MYIHLLNAETTTGEEATYFDLQKHEPYDRYAEIHVGRGTTRDVVGIELGTSCITDFHMGSKFLSCVDKFQYSVC